ncbi:MAG: rane protein [Cryobacterium sp.]|jgi:hypothetical protein|nr:rane protein [Cryobacterium sp.]
MILLRGGFGGFGEAIVLTVPVVPDAPEARQWLREELAKAPYQAAKPTWFDRLSQAFLDWIGSLGLPEGDGFGAWIPLILTVLAVAVLIVALLIFGLPRLNRRSGLAAPLFGENDRRTADDLRRAARFHATSADWNSAVQDMFRAIARALAERTIVRPTPGTTAHGFAERAAGAFPNHRERLEAAATAFDSVRYLGRDAAEGDFLAIAALDEELAAARPAGPVLAEATTGTSASPQQSEVS